MTLGCTHEECRNGYIWNTKLGQQPCVLCSPKVGEEQKNS
jgi:hypothetical protein